MILGLLITSSIINIFFIWYVYTLLKKLLFVSDNMEDFLEVLKEYSNHLEKIYNMETYYGDETIEHLLTHSKEIVKEIEVYEEIYTLMKDKKEQEEEQYGEET